MSVNPSISKLDASQIAQRVFDETNDAIRFEVAAATGISINLDHATDSITVYGNGLAASSAALDSTSSGAAIATTACVGTKSFQLYAIADTITTGSLVVRIDVSPQDSGTVFFQSSTTLTLAASALGTVVASSILSSLLARRVKVTITSNGLGVGETAHVYLVGNSL